MTSSLTPKNASQPFTSREAPGGNFPQARWLMRNQKSVSFSAWCRPCTTSRRRSRASSSSGGATSSRWRTARTSTGGTARSATGGAYFPPPTSHPITPRWEVYTRSLCLLTGRLSFFGRETGSLMLFFLIIFYIEMCNGSASLFFFFF